MRNAECRVEKRSHLSPNPIPPGAERGTTGWRREDLVVGGAVGDGGTQGEFAVPMEDVVLVYVGFDGGAGEDEAGNGVAARDQFVGGEEGDDGAVGVGDEPKRGLRVEG